MEQTKNSEIFTKVVLEIFKTAGLLNIEGDRLTQEFSLTSSRWKILGAITLSETPITVPQIGRLMGQSRQAVQKLADIMTKDGLLNLVGNPNHKRANYIELTPKGKKMYSEIEAKQILWAKQCSSTLKKPELETTLKVLKNISGQMET